MDHGGLGRWYLLRDNATDNVYTVNRSLFSQGSMVRRLTLLTMYAG